MSTSTLPVSTVRQRVAAALAACGTPSQWKESRWPYDTFPAAEGGQFAHLAFAVGVVQTDFGSPIESSLTNRGAQGGLVESQVRVRWTFAIRADGAVADVDAAYDAEGQLLMAVLGLEATYLHCYAVGMSRSMVGDGAWMLGEASFNVQHRIALQ